MSWLKIWLLWIPLIKISGCECLFLPFCHFLVRCGLDVNINVATLVNVGQRQRCNVATSTSKVDNLLCLCLGWPNQRRLVKYFFVDTLQCIGGVTRWPTLINVNNTPPTLQHPCSNFLIIYNMPTLAPDFSKLLLFPNLPLNFISNSKFTQKSFHIEFSNMLKDTMWQNQV